MELIIPLENITLVESAQQVIPTVLRLADRVVVSFSTTDLTRNLAHAHMSTKEALALADQLIIYAMRTMEKKADEAIDHSS